MKTSEEIKNDLKNLEQNIENLCNKFADVHGQHPNVNSYIEDAKIGFNRSIGKCDFKIKADVSINNKS